MESLLVALVTVWAPAADAIDIYPENPRYWAYKGEPVLLIGGSVEDNLFQIPDLAAHLDLLASVGGNYVRNTMSSRDPGNVWPFKKVGERYDLEQWDETYWQRFEDFLRLTAEREIFVQIEVWATFDYYQERWDVNPFNPKNNVNYGREASGLPVRVNSHPLRCENPFFWSVPAEHNRDVVLKYQERFVNKLLDHALKYGHVLYCMDNETAVTPAWGAYWSEFIKARAAEAGVKVHTTEMWDPWNLADPKHSNTFDHPETYSFIDISQNNHQKGQRHWDNAQAQRRRIAARPRPLNNTKIYGADDGPFGNTRDGVERFWRNVIGGMASARFHRPTAGIGLNETAQAHLRSARMLADAYDFFTSEPDLSVLDERDDNEAYATVRAGESVAVYFPHGGEVLLREGVVDGPATVRWLDIAASTWQEPVTASGTGPVRLACSGPGHWVAVVTR